MLKNCCTGKDNETHDGIKIIGLIALIIFLALEVHDVYETGKFDMVNFSNSLSTMIGAIGVTLRIKAATEPE